MFYRCKSFDSDQSYLCLDTTRSISLIMKSITFLIHLSVNPIQILDSCGTKTWEKQAGPSSVNRSSLSLILLHAQMEAQYIGIWMRGPNGQLEFIQTAGESVTTPTTGVILGKSIRVTQAAFCWSGLRLLEYVTERLLILHCLWVWGRSSKKKP